MLPAHLHGSINSPSSLPPKQMRHVGSSSSSSRGGHALGAYAAGLTLSRGLSELAVIRWRLCAIKASSIL